MLFNELAVLLDIRIDIQGQHLQCSFVTSKVYFICLTVLLHHWKHDVHAAWTEQMRLLWQCTKLVMPISLFICTKEPWLYSSQVSILQGMLDEQDQDCFNFISRQYSADVCSVILESRHGLCPQKRCVILGDPYEASKCVHAYHLRLQAICYTSDGPETLQTYFSTLVFWVYTF